MLFNFTDLRTGCANPFFKHHLPSRILLQQQKKGKDFFQKAQVSGFSELPSQSQNFLPLFFFPFKFLLSFAESQHVYQPNYDLALSKRPGDQVLGVRRHFHVFSQPVLLKLLAVSILFLLLWPFQCHLCYSLCQLTETTFTCKMQMTSSGFLAQLCGEFSTCQNQKKKISSYYF